MHICSVSSCITGRRYCNDFASMVVSNVVKAEGSDNSSTEGRRLLLFLYSYLY